MGIRLGSKLYQSRPGMLLFECPACGYCHPVYLDQSYRNTAGEVQQWKWNGDADKPTFTPSLNIFANDPARRCHSIITAGKIAYCGDSFHVYKNQTLDIPDLD